MDQNRSEQPPALDDSFASPTKRLQLRRTKGWKMPPNQVSCYNGSHDGQILGCWQAGRNAPLSDVRGSGDIAPFARLHGRAAHSLPHQTTCAEQLTAKGRPISGPLSGRGEAIRNAGGQEGTNQARLSPAAARHHYPTGRPLRGLRPPGSPGAPSSSPTRGRLVGAGREGLALSLGHGRDDGSRTPRNLSAAMRQLPSGRTL